MAIGKLDLPVTRERWKDAVDIFAQKGIKLIAFSAATGEGVPEALRELIALIPPQAEIRGDDAALCPRISAPCLRNADEREASPEERPS